MRRFALLGHPLGHSFSKGYFTAKFSELNLSAEYVNIDHADVREAVAILRNTPAIAGANVTIPFKSAIIPLLDRVSPEAARIGAVNTLEVTRDKGSIRLTGHNTDVIGFHKSIAPLIDETHDAALVLGTGGAAKAALSVLNGLGMKTSSVSRHSGGGTYTYDELDAAIMKAHRLIVNCTPIGMFPRMNDCPDLPYSAVGKTHVLFDMVYNPLETAFMLVGMERGATVSNGLAMLHAQAEASWAIWNNEARDGRGTQ